MRKELYENSKTFCIAPWVRACLRTGGSVNPCCEFSPDILSVNDSLKNAFESSEWNELRRRMLTNKPIKGCENCYVKEESGLKSVRNLFNEEYLTEDNFDPKLKDLHLEISNICNFKCVICGHSKSSRWYSDEKYLKTLVDREGFDIDLNNKIIDSFDSLHDLDYSNIEALRFLGGEPLLDDRFLDVLDRVDLSKTFIMISTNNSIDPTDKWLKYLDKAKKLAIMISVDGINDVGEFVRDGMNFEKFVSNLKIWDQLLSSKPSSYMFYHFVVSNFNVTNLKDSYEYLTSLYDAEFTFSFCKNHPKYLDISYLPLQVKDYIISELREFEHVDIIKKYMYNNDYDKKVCQDFIKYTMFLEKKSQFPTQIETIFDKVTKWIV